MSWWCVDVTTRCFGGIRWQHSRYPLTKTPWKSDLTWPGLTHWDGGWRQESDFSGSCISRLSGWTWIKALKGFLNKPNADFFWYLTQPSSHSSIAFSLKSLIFDWEQVESGSTPCSAKERMMQMLLIGCSMQLKGSIRTFPRWWITASGICFTKRERLNRRQMLHNRPKAFESLQTKRKKRSKPGKRIKIQPGQEDASCGEAAHWLQPSRSCQKALS